MNQPSCSDSQIEEIGLESSSRSGSSSPSSTEVYSAPLGFDSSIILSQDEQNLLEVPGNLSVAQGAQSVISNSPNAWIGTNFNVSVDGDTKIIVNNIHAPVENSPDKNDLNTTQKSSENTLHRVRYVFVPSAIVLLLLLLTVSLIVFRTSIFNTSIPFPPVDPDTDYFMSGYPVYYRSNWGALDEKQSPPNISLPTSLVIISHSATQGCKNFTECANRTQNIQYDFLQNGHRDIGYNFLIGGEGGIYVGRGWDHQNSIRPNSLTVAFIGDFNKEFATESSEKAAHALLAEGIKVGKIDTDYKLIGENQTSPKRYYSPGWNMVGTIRKWDHYFSGTML